MVDNNQATDGALGSSTRRNALATFGTAAGVLLGTSGMASAQENGLSISADPDPPTVGEETTFTGNAAFVDEWRWFIARPDGTMVRKSGQSVTVTFEQTGNYSAGLFAKFSDGEVKDVAKEGTIEGSGGDSGGGAVDPVANIEYSPQDPVANPISFDGSGSSTPEGEIESYEWYHKRGEPDSDGMFEYVLQSETYEDSFEAGTTWSVKLEVTNAAGNTATETVTFTPAETELVAKIEYSPQDPVYNPITFDASGSRVVGGGTVSYDWYHEKGADTAEEDLFAGSPTASGETFEESYAAGTTWTVGVEVTNSNGDMGRDSVTVSPIDKTPTAVVEQRPDEVTPSNPVTLDASGSTTPVGEIVSYEWVIDKHETINEKVGTIERSGAVLEEDWEADILHIYDLTITTSTGETATARGNFRPEA